MSKKQTTSNTGMPDSRTTIIATGIEEEILWLMTKLTKKYSAKDAAMLKTYAFFYPMMFVSARDTYLDKLKRKQLQLERADEPKEGLEQLKVAVQKVQEQERIP